MLQSIREHTHGWIAGAIISIIILTFALWGIHSYFEGGGANTVVAVVNGVDINKEQLTVAYERMRRQMQTQPSRDDATLKERALKSLIDVEVLKQASTKQGFLVSNQQIDNYLQNMPEFQVDGQFSVQRFQEILSSTLMTTGDFLEIIKTGLLIDQPRLGLVLTSFALPEETSNTIALVNQERDINYVTIPMQTFLAAIKTISPDKIQAYYDQHRDDFMTPEQVNVEYIELSIKDLYSRFNPTDAILKTFYNENINSYSRPTAWKLMAINVPLSPTATDKDVKDAQAIANELAEKVKNEDAFKSAAKQYPDKNISDQTYVTLNQVPAELQKSVSELARAGQITDPVKTPDGFVIVKAVDIKPPQIEPFEMVQQKVKDTYVHQHAEEKFAEMRERLADLTYEHPDTLQFAANALELPVKTSELFTKNKAGKEIAQFKKVRDIAFSNDVMNLQNNSDVIQINPETIVVLRVKSHIPSALLPLKDISAQITDKLKTKEAELEAEKFANDLLAKLNTDTANVDQLAAENNLKWTNLGYLGRYSTKVDTAVLDAAFRLPNPTTIKKSVVYGATRMPNGFAIVGVKGVKPGTADAKQNQVFAEQVQNSEGFLEYELYKQSQIANARIKVTQ